LENIDCFSNLHSLDVSHCQIDYLPSKIGKLTDLSELSLNNNHITTLPKEFANLRNLGELTLDDNYIKVLPTCLTSCRNLYRLSVSSAYLQDVEILKDLAGLEWLQLEIYGSVVDSLHHRIYNACIDSTYTPNSDKWLSNTSIKEANKEIQEFPTLKIICLFYCKTQKIMVPDTLGLDMHKIAKCDYCTNVALRRHLVKL